MRLTEEQIDRVVAATEGRGRGDRPYFELIAGRGILCEHCTERELERIGIRRVVVGRRT